LFVRERTPRWIVLYGVYLCLSGLSYRRASAALTPFARRCWTAVWLWVQGLGGAVEGLFTPRARVVWVDETQVWVHGRAWWLWVAYDLDTRAIVRLRLTAVRDGFQALAFLLKLRDHHGVRTVYTNGGSWYPWAASQARLAHKIMESHERNP